MQKWNVWVLGLAVATMGAAAQKPTGAAATLAAKSGSELTGTITFKPAGDHVHVTVHVEHVKPGEHGVHVHEKGDCSDPEAKNAGGHFNPEGMQHGAPGSAMHHPGDFGNITVGADGTGTLELDTKSISLDPSDKLSVIGHAVIVHEKVDDLKTQPTGNAGGRIGCGVINAT